MRRAAIALGLLAAGAITWTILASVSIVARLWGVALLVALPAWTAFEARQFRDVGMLPRLPIYISSSVALAVLAVLTAAAAALGGFSAADLGFVPVSPDALLAWAAAVTVAGIAFVFVCRALGVRESATLEQLLPRTGVERRAFAGVSVVAGITEEFIYRGFLLSSLLAALGSPAAAALIAAAAFGVVHGYQAHQGAARAAVLGMMLTAPVLATGSLFPSMVAHMALDLILGLILADRLID